MDTGTRGFPRSDIRVSDAERDQAVAELSEHFQAGRLTQDEFDDRSGLALKARTGTDLGGLFGDLPPQYAVTKAAVVTLTECLYAQLQDAGAAVGASILFPGPNMLRTGIFSSWRVRPEELAKERPRQTPYPTIEDIEGQMAAAGIEVHYTEPAEVADQVVHAVRSGDFWIMAPSDSIDAQIQARSRSMLNRANPTYLREVPG